MSIIIKAEFEFAEIVKFRAKVINRVEYKDIFFLVKRTLKILFS
jgi:hypothetical protein